MRKAAVRHGDPTTTRGFVIAVTSTIFDDGKRVALSGDEATCGNCKGTWKIYGTGKGISEKGRDAVIDGDLVQCPCKKNRVIVGSKPGIFLNTHQGTSNASRPPQGVSVPQIVPALGFARDEDESEVLHPATAVDAGKAPDCSYLDGSKARIDAPANFYKRTNKVTVSPGKQTTFDFPGGGTDAATQYDATVNGHPVSIYVPSRNPENGYGIPSWKEIANSLESVPPQQYKDLNNVSINPSANPQDAIWQKVYSNPSFSSAATASIDQGVAFYPWKGWPTIPQQYVDSTMLHETGHLWSEALWKDQAMKEEWLGAMTSDGQAPSQYARNNMNEDFAESANMYWSSKGTSCEAEGRKRYPARYTYFDKVSK